MKKEKKALALAIALILIMLLVLICGIAYAKYISSASGSASAPIATMICNMDVKSSSEDNNGNVITPSDKTIINPYCIVTVKNFEGADISNPDKLTETNVHYTVTVKPKEDAQGNPTFTLPVCNWYEITSPSATTGTKIATSAAAAESTAVSGDFGIAQGQVKYYKIVFLNSGERDVTEYVDFELNAVQSR